MKIILRCLILMAILLLCNLVPFKKALATADVQKPELKSLSVDKTKVYAGDTLNLTAEVRDEGGSGVSSVTVIYTTPITQKWQFVNLSKVDDATFKGYIKLNDTFEEGKWKISTVSVLDGAGNSKDYHHQFGSFSWTGENLLDLSHTDFIFKEINDSNLPVTTNERPPFMPEGVIYDNTNFEDVLNIVKVEYKNKEILSKNIKNNNTIDGVIKETLNNIDAELYYFDKVEVEKSTILYLGSDLTYSGPYNDIVITVKSYQDLNRPVVTPSIEVPTTEKPTTERPTTERPTTEKPTTEKPTTEEPTTEKPTTERPTTEKPTTEKPTTERPTTEKPVVKPAPKPITNTKPSVNSIDDNDTKVTGKAKSGSTVYAIVNKKIIGQGVAKDGKFSFTIKKLPAGTNVQVYSVYKKVKSSVITTKVIDKTPPAFTSLNAMTTQSQYVSGKGEKDAVVTVMRSNKQIAAGKVSAKNTFKVKVGAQKRGTTLTVYLIDKAGNVSKKSVKVS